MEPDGPESILHEWHRRFIGPVTDSSAVYAGFGLFFAGVGLVVVSIATFLWSTTYPAGEPFKYVLREMAVTTGAGGVPTVLLGVTVLLPVSRRVDAIGAAGVVACVVATARFRQVYPQAWYTHSSVVVGLYALGAVVVVATAGTALSSYHAERTGRQIAEQQLKADDGDEEGDATADVTDAEVQADIEEAMAGAEINWGGVERDNNRSITLTTPDEEDFERPEGAGVGATETRGGSVDDAVEGLRGLQGGERKTESGSGTDEQATALAELRAMQDERDERDESGGFLDTLRSLFR